MTEVNWRKRESESISQQIYVKYQQLPTAIFDNLLKINKNKLNKEFSEKKQQIPNKNVVF